MNYYNYNYYVKELLIQKYDYKISLPIIINRVKRNDCYFLKTKEKAHDKEVLINYLVVLIQHDRSCDKWSPYAVYKWLITSLDSLI